jgi:hypothetical protein
MKNQTRMEASKQTLGQALANKKAESGALGIQVVSTFCLTAALALGLAMPVGSMADDSGEWAKILGGVSSTPAAETKPASKKTPKPVATKKAAKEAGSQKAKPAVAKAATKPKAEANEWAKAAASLGTTTVAAETKKPVQTEEVVTVSKSEWAKALAALSKETSSAQGPAVEVAKAEVKVAAPPAKSEPKASEPKKEELAKAEPAKSVAKTEATVVAAAIDPKKTLVESSKPAAKKAKPGKGTRWVEVQSATLSHRYRYMENSAGVVTNNQIQHNEGFKGKFKFDKKGNYAINAGLFSGNNLTGGWNNTGSGKDKLFTNLYLKQLYLEAKPFKGIELQYGSLYPNRGENTEITSYDNDLYLMGERVSLKRPKNLFFDEVSATYGFIGDATKPNVNKRWFRLKESNYHQFLVSKKIGKRVSLTWDYTFQNGTETLREAIKVNAKGSKVLDTFLFENYQRTDVKPDYGFAIFGEKALHKRFTVGGGFADIDPNYGGLNADRFNKGKRVYLASKFNITPEFAVQTFVTQAMYNTFAVANKTRLDLIFSYDVLKTLQRAGLLAQPAGK